jgi:hypothetical protein
VISSFTTASSVGISTFSSFFAFFSGFGSSSTTLDGKRFSISSSIFGASILAKRISG